MALIKWSGQDVWEPFRDLAKLEEDMNRVFGKALWPMRTGNGKGEAAWWPEVDIVEEKDRILVRADLPGMRQEDIQVEINGELLTMRGERKQEFEKTEGQLHRIERSRGSFFRSFSLPSTVDAAKITASYKNGVLELTLPKREGTRAKQIKVEVK